MKIAYMEKSMCCVRCGSAIGISGSNQGEVLPRDFVDHHELWILDPDEFCGLGRNSTRQSRRRITRSAKRAHQRQSQASELWMSLPGTRKCLSENTASVRGCRENNPANGCWLQKKHSGKTRPSPLPQASQTCPEPLANNRHRARLRSP